MKNKLKSFSLSFISLALGVFLTVMAFRYFPALQQKVAKSAPPPTRQMQVWNDFHQAQKQMLQHFDKLFKDDFDDDFLKNDPFQNFQIGSSDQTGIGELTQREDDHFVYFDLAVEDLNHTSIQSKVENGYLTVSGTVETKNSDEGYEKVYKSEFHRTFPLPAGIDAKKMEVVSEGHRVTFKFPKV